MKSKLPCRPSGAIIATISKIPAYGRPGQPKVHADIHLVVGEFVEVTENSSLHLQ
jgi:hypothetical protein